MNPPASDLPGPTGSPAPEALVRALADRYRLDGEIGSGGMAVVYRAHDLKHNRVVAIKVLRPELAAVIGAERFLAEIETTAQLQHPHILPLFDSGQADSFLFYVMPLVEGESLEDRLRRERQLPVDEAVRIGAEAAEALDYAHRHGVVHRDVKPANLLLHDGRVLVSDFGIALAVREAGGQRMTETGLSLGTPHYMSPEQATAERDADARSDVYALGAVVYEMLAGRPPHAGTSLQAVLASVLTKTPPPVDEDRPAVPAALAAVVAKAIERLPADRFQSAGDLAQALRHPERFAPRAAAGAGAGAAVGTEGSRGAPTGSKAGPRAGERAAWAALAILGLAVGAWGSLKAGKPAADPSRPAVRFVVEIPDAMLSAVAGDAARVALSPDGSTLYLVAPDAEGGAPRLLARRLDAVEATPLPTADVPSSPAVSPDGRSLAFNETELSETMARVGRISLLDLATGRRSSVYDGLGAYSPTWGPDGRLHAVTESGDIIRIGDGGGVDTLYQVPESEVQAGNLPNALAVIPGGRFLVFRGGAEAAAGRVIALVLLDLETGETRTIVQDGSGPRYLPFGVLAYQTSQGGLLGVLFDSASGTVSGEPRSLAEGLRWDDDLAFAWDVSPAGIVAWETDPHARSELVWVERDGGERLVDATLPAGIMDVSLDSEGSRIAYHTGQGGRTEVWVYDLDQRTSSRVSAVEAENWRPVWTTEGDVAFVSNRDGGMRGIWARPPDGSGPARPVVRTDRLVQQATWSRDGSMLFREGFSDALTNRDIGYRLPGDTVNRAWLATEADEHSPEFSPDGRWVAYVSDEDGDYRVFLRPFPGPGGRVPVSSGAAASPRWGPDGGTLYYLTPSDSLVEARLEFGAGGPRVLGRAPLFSTARYLADEVDRAFDVHPDGERFLFVRMPPTARVQVVTDWFREVKAAFGIGDR